MPSSERRSCSGSIHVMVRPGGGRLRVLTLVDSLRPGGAERLAATLAIHLDRSRFEPIVCVSRTIATPSPLIDDLNEAGVSILPLTRSSRRALRAWSPLLGFLHREQVDILHSHMFGSNAWGAAFAILSRTPVFVAHEHGSASQGGSLRSFLDRWLIGRAADAFIAVSQEDRRKMINVFGIPSDKVRLVMNGIVPLQPPRSDLRAELGIPPDAEVVGTLAVLRREKALEILIDAAKLLALTFPRLKVLIAGTGPEEKQLRALVRARDLEDTVVMLGFRSHVADVLAALDVAAFTSDREGSPLAVMESMAAGKPVVATRVGGVPELIEDGVHGLLVPPRDPGALADAVTLLLRDPSLRAELGRRGRERQRRDFDIAATVRRVEDLYEELVAAARRAG